MSVSVEPVSLDFINSSIKRSMDSCQENDQYAYLRQHIAMQMQSWEPRQAEEESHKRRRLSSFSECTDSEVDDTLLHEDLENWLKRTSFEVASNPGNASNQVENTMQQSHDENLPSSQGHISDVSSSEELHTQPQSLESSNRQKFLDDALSSYQQKEPKIDIEPQPLNGMERQQFLEDALSSYQKKLTERQASLPGTTAASNVCTQQIKKQRCASANLPLALSPSPRGLLFSFSNAMEKSHKSEQDIFEWDRKMGLRENHCRTMGATRKSRRMLKELQKNVGLEINQHSAKGA